MPPRNLPKCSPPGSPRPSLTPNPQLSSDWGNTSMILDPEKEDWVSAWSTSGWAPHSTHSLLSSPEAIWAPPKKTRMRLDSGLSTPSSPSGLGNTSATTLFIGKLIESLCPLYKSGIVDTQVDPRSVDSSAVRSMLIYVNQWAKNLENVKFLNSHPVEKDSILGSFGVMSEAFNNIGLYSKAPPLASLSPKAADFPPPIPTSSSPPCPHPTAPVPVLVTSAAGVTVGGSAWKKKKVVECSGTSCDTCARADPSSPPPHWYHTTCTHHACHVLFMYCCQVWCVPFYVHLFLSALILSSGFAFPAIFCIPHVKPLISYCITVVHQTVLSTPGYKLLI